jgi:hypothetical protein
MARDITDWMFELLLALAIGVPLAILGHFFGDERVQNWFEAVTLVSLAFGFILWIVTRRAKRHSKLVRVMQGTALVFMIVGMLALL